MSTFRLMQASEYNCCIIAIQKSSKTIPCLPVTWHTRASRGGQRRQVRDWKPEVLILLQLFLILFSSSLSPASQLSLGDCGARWTLARQPPLPSSPSSIFIINVLPYSFSFGIELNIYYTDFVLGP